MTPDNMKSTMLSFLARFSLGFFVFNMYSSLDVLAVRLPHRSQGIVGEVVAQSTAPSWGIVLGADKALGRALALADIKKALIRVEPKIYSCNGWFRVVAVYPDRGSALASLRTAISATSDAPYLVSMQNWCTSGRQININVETRRLVENIFSADRDIRRTSTAILREKQWEARPHQVLTQIYSVYADKRNNYYGLVNSLYLLRFMPTSTLKSNRAKVQEIVRSAQKVLSPKDKKDYIVPITAKVN